MEEDEVESHVEQQVWSWGAGTEGQLGTEKLQDEDKPQLLHSFSSFGSISFLSCGGAHVIALTSGGRTLTWGRGTSGQLGHGVMVNSLQPKPVESLKSSVITHVSAGWNHSGFVSENGCLFTCGDGSFGQLGHGDYNSRCSPEKLSHMNSRHVEQVACGMRHSLAMVKADGQLYAWGRGFSGASDVHIPHYVNANLSFREAALGWNHSLLLSGDAQVFVLGGYGNGILVSPEMTVERTHRSEESGGVISRIPGLGGSKVLQIAAGAEHSALVTDDGSIMTWGWGEHGQLGLGDTVDHSIPQVLSLDEELTKKRSVCKVYCGSGFTYAIRTPVVDSQV